MASRFVSKPPVWFWIVAVVLTLWEIAGVWSWYEHVTLGPASMGNVPTEWDKAYYAALPGWYAWLYGLAVFSGLAAGLLLLARKAAARPAAWLSLAATIAMFAYTFLGTKMLERGAWTAYFPAFIIFMGFVTVWFAGVGVRRGWLR